MNCLVNLVIGGLGLVGPSVLMECQLLMHLYLYLVNTSSLCFPFDCD